MHEYFYFVDFVRNVKIMEYGVAFLFIGLFALYYRFMMKPEAAPAMALHTAVGHAMERIRGLLAPEGLAYHRGHAWVKVEGPQMALAGVDDFASKLVGKIQSVKLPEVGAVLKQGEKAWSLQVDGKTVDMLSPLDGKVVAVNPAAAAALADDPYGKGWLVKLESPKLTASLKNLLTGSLAKVFTEQSIDALFSRAGGNLGAMAADGGTPVQGMARNIDPQHWERIAKDFVLTTD